MRRLIIVAGGALALLSGAGRAQVASGVPDPRVRDLARAVVAGDGVQARWSSLGAAMEPAMAQQIDKALGLTDAARKAQVGGVVHNGLEALGGDLAEARVSVLAGTYTVQELEGVLAFRHSSTGQAYLRAAPELSREITEALRSGAPVADGPEPSEQKLALINRILKARDVENSARKAYRVLNSAMTQALSASGLSKDATSPSAPTDDRTREDAYAKLMVAVSVRFYAKTFTDEQLTELAAYFEGPTGRAEREHASQLTSEAANLAPKVFERRFERIDAEACEAVSCSASQRAALDAQLAKIRSMMVAGMTAFAR